MAEQNEINMKGNRNKHNMEVTCDGAIDMQLSNEKREQKEQTNSPY